MLGGGDRGGIGGGRWTYGFVQGDGGVRESDGADEHADGVVTTFALASRYKHRGSLLPYRTVWFLLSKYVRAEFTDGGAEDCRGADRERAVLKKCRAGWDRVRWAHDWQTHGFRRTDLVIEPVDIVAVVVSGFD